MSGSTITLEQILGFLLETPMFQKLSAAELSQVLHIMQIQRLRPGQFVFREGDSGDAWYVIYAGEITVLKETAVGTNEVATMGPRGCFGEMAILDGRTRSASVQASASSTVFRFPRLGFSQLLDEENLAAYKLIHQMALVLSSRQRATTASLAELLRRDELNEVWEHLSPIVKRSTVTE